MKFIVLFDKEQDCYIIRYTGYYNEYMAMFDRYTPILITGSASVADKVNMDLNRGLNE